MGSWTEFDAYYPPGKLTPATAFIVALGHLAGADSVYADKTTGKLADFLPGQELVPFGDILERAERYLQSVSVEDFLVEARERLNPQQKLCLMLNVLDRTLAAGAAHPDAQAVFVQFLEGLGVAAEQIEPYRRAFVLKHDLSVFPQ